MHWTLWLHCLYDTSVLPGATLPLKVLILWVPMHRHDVRAVISCPMSGPASAGHGGHLGGPQGTIPPAGCSGTGVGFLSGPHLPPPGKVTSQSSSLGSLLPHGHAHSFGGGCWGAQLILLHYFLCKVLYKLSELMVIEVANLHLVMIQGSPTWGSL